VVLTGRIAAGRRLEAVATEEAFSLAFELLTTRLVRRRYLLRVVGQSMVRARIDEDGDLLVVEVDEASPDEAVMVAFCGTGRT
jgi:repressor LexA